jgi:hypothetical protein
VGSIDPFAENDLPAVNRPQPTSAVTRSPGWPFRTITPITWLLSARRAVKM